MNEIKAIETKYNGYHFRSRLEARWAVFFDSMEIRYEYEPEGFDLGKYGWYLPDFRLLDYGYFVEIKPWLAPEDMDSKGILKAFELSKAHKVLFISGFPGKDDYHVNALLPDESDHFFGYKFARGRNCDRLWLVDTSRGHQRALNCENCWSQKCGDKETFANFDLDEAFEAARSARF